MTIHDFLHPSRTTIIITAKSLIVLGLLDLWRNWKGAADVCECLFFLCLIENAWPNAHAHFCVTYTVLQADQWIVWLHVYYLHYEWYQLSDGGQATSWFPNEYLDHLVIESFLLQDKDIFYANSRLRDENLGKIVPFLQTTKVMKFFCEITSR